MPDNNNDAIPAEQPPVSPELIKQQEALCAGRSVIGIDIGITSVNVAQTANYHGKPTIIKVLAEDINLAHEKDRDSETLRALKHALSVFNTRKADIICVIPSRQTLTENMIMPVMPPAEMIEAVKLEVSSSQHFPIQNPVLDFQVVGRIVDKGVEKFNVLVSAAARGSIDRLLAYFYPEQAKPMVGSERRKPEDSPVGLDVSSIIPVSIALENIIRKSKLKIDETMAIIEIGTVATELNIYRDSQLEFCRQISVTGFDFTKCLTRPLSTNAGKIELSVEEAESIKRQHGIPEMGDNYLINDKITSGQVLALLRPKLEQFTGEIGRCFDYYHEKINAGKVDRIIAFGGGAMLKGLPEYMSMELGIPVHRGDPLQDVEFIHHGVLGRKEDGQRLALAIGASLGDLKGINLLPQQFKDRKKRARQKMIVILLAALLSGAFGFVLFGLQAKISQSRKEMAAAGSEYQKLVPQVDDFKKKLKFQEFVHGRADLAGLFKVLSHLPPTMALTDLDIKEGVVHMSGVLVPAEGEDPQEPMNQLLKDLQHARLPSASIVSTKAVPQKVGVFEFEIQGEIGGPGENN